LSVKIHHGPPGAYKTSGAVQEDFVQAVQKGRFVVTNIRGLFDKKQIVKVLKKNAKLTDEAARRFQIINLDTSREINRERMRRFFHWAPRGTYFLLDEINTIYPKTWRESQLSQYDYPGGVDNATSKGRAANVTEAFEMHRHYNYDFSVTTPSITKVHEIIKTIAEVSFLHQNKATIGLAGSYWEIMHYADNTGRGRGDQLMHSSKKIKKWVFDLYKSTATGEVSDSIAGRNVFNQPKVWAFSVFVLAFLIYAVRAVTRLVSGEEEIELAESSQGQQIPDQTPVQAQNQTPSPTPPSQGNSGLPSRNGVQVRAPVGQKLDFVEQMLAKNIVYVGSIYAGQHLLEIEGTTVEFKIMEKEGAKIREVAKCIYVLKYKKSEQLIMCPQTNEDPSGPMGAIPFMG